MLYEGGTRMQYLEPQMELVSYEETDIITVSEVPNTTGDNKEPSIEEVIPDWN